MIVTNPNGTPASLYCLRKEFGSSREMMLAFAHSACYGACRMGMFWQDGSPCKEFITASGPDYILPDKWYGSRWGKRVWADHIQSGWERTLDGRWLEVARVWYVQDGVWYEKDGVFNP